MSAAFEELDWAPTPLGPVSLRRRRDPRLGEVWEIKLGVEFLMTSAFTVSEVALARLALAELEGEGLRVAVGGLGLGHTAAAVLDDPRVADCLTVELLAPVIDWHARGLVPLGPQLSGDPRHRVVQGDFFALAASEAGFDPEAPGRRFDAVLLDIDHSPDELLSDGSAGFYRPQGLADLRRHLRPGGVFGLWSNSPPDPAFTERLRGVFPRAWAKAVSFPNPLQDRTFTQSVQLAGA